MRLIEADALLAEFDRREAEPEYQHEGEDWYCGLISGEELVMEAPTIKPEQRWIPCTPDTMPKKPEQVLIYAWNVHYVLAKYREIRTGEGIYKMAWVVEDAYHAPFEIKHDVIAWMPLPEPWREENR